MPVTFRLIPELGLVFVRYEGHAVIEDTAAAFADYVRSPGFAPGQKQFVDLSEVTSMKTDYADLMDLQVQKAFALVGRGVQTLIAYHAPTPETLEIARLSQRSWEGIDAVIPRVFTRRAEALAFLGIAECSFARVMARV